MAYVRKGQKTTYAHKRVNHHWRFRISRGHHFHRRPIHLQWVCHKPRKRPIYIIRIRKSEKWPFSVEIDIHFQNKRHLAVTSVTDRWHTKATPCRPKVTRSQHRPGEGRIRKTCARVCALTTVPRPCVCARRALAREGIVPRGAWGAWPPALLTVGKFFFISKFQFP